MDETNKIDTLEREVNALKQSMEQMKSETTTALSKMNDTLATKDQEINNLRVSIEELKKNYEVEETVNDAPKPEETPAPEGETKNEPTA